MREFCLETQKNLKQGDNRRSGVVWDSVVVHVRSIIIMLLYIVAKQYQLYLLAS